MTMMEMIFYNKGQHKGDDFLKKAAILMTALILTIFLTACADSENSGSEDQAAPIPEVEVLLDQQPYPINEPVDIRAEVTQNDEPVPDASYVKFEIWNTEEGQDTSETKEAEHTEAGIYELSYTFEQEGSYQVIAHTQVGDLHTMPQKEVKVGTGHEGHSMEMESSKFMVHLMTEETFSAGSESMLTAHINHMEEPFTGGQVTYIITPEAGGESSEVTAEEKQPGEYQGSYTFEETGNYTVTVVYEQEEKELEGRKEQTIEVTE
ncbi:hypothetical protein GLW03_10665 [Halobacillus halophilus]|nr:hypothetical protein [Halobacillus halophilus]